MSVAAIIVAALAIWGYAGISVEFVIEDFPPNYSEGTLAGGAPDGNGGCWVKVEPAAWARWKEPFRIRVVAHELYHCLTASAHHDNEPNSIMTGGIGTDVMPWHWTTLRESRPQLTYRTVVSGLAR